MLDRPLTNYWSGALLGARKDQQDSYLAQELNAAGDLLAIVADGMGGQAAGALASQTATKAFSDVFVNLLSRGGGLQAAFDGALHAANEAIHHSQEARAEREGMGTTLLAVHVSDQGLSWVSVGDSPLLLCRGQSISRLNEDHSLRGLPEFRGGPHGNMLRSALTGQEISLIDFQVDPLPLRSGDVLILASDGLLSLDAQDIIAELSAPDLKAPGEIGQRLLDAVSEKNDPRQDNCTVIAIGMSSIERAPPIIETKPRRARPRPIGTVVILLCIAFVLVLAALIVWLG